MKAGEYIVCKDDEALKKHMTELEALGYAMHIDYKKRIITVLEEPESERVDKVR